MSNKQFCLVALSIYSLRRKVHIIQNVIENGTMPWEMYERYIPTWIPMVFLFSSFCPNFQRSIITGNTDYDTNGVIFFVSTYCECDKASWGSPWNIFTKSLHTLRSLQCTFVCIYIHAATICNSNEVDISSIYEGKIQLKLASSIGEG